MRMLRGISEGQHVAPSFLPRSTSKIRCFRSSMDTDTSCGALAPPSCCSPCSFFLQAAWRAVDRILGVVVVCLVTPAGLLVLRLGGMLANTSRGTGHHRGLHRQHVWHTGCRGSTCVCSTNAEALQRSGDVDMQRCLTKGNIMRICVMTLVHVDAWGWEGRKAT